MDSMMTFPALAGTPHGLILRHPELLMDVEREEAVRRLSPWHEDHVQALGFSRNDLRLAEQVHGDGVAVVGAESPAMSAGVDGLISDKPGVLLGIYVADCCAAFLHDPVNLAFGLVHSGKKGSELGIVGSAIQRMKDAFGSDPADMVVQLSPCIRPPAYEVDFAGDIRAQCREMGVKAENLHDCGLCTSADLQRFYSYRVEKGKTGRMLALLGRVRS